MNYFVLLLFLFVLPVCAQESNIWYFGDKAGLDFRQGSPLVLTDGALVAWEGVATICDKDGKLLFYTDGTVVYNAKHKVMTNGKNLYGNMSATQSAVIVPKIGSQSQYYIFTVPEGGKAQGLCYSVVDMSLDDGLGDIVVTSKNISLHTPVTEKLTAIKHRNGSNIWVITHEWKSDKFLAYLITEKGVENQPVVSEIGSAHLPLKMEVSEPLNTHGYLKFSPDGTSLGLALQGDNIVEIFDFDSEKGKVFNPITIKLPQKSYPYGIEFSPNSSIVYISTVNSIYQYNLQKSIKDSINYTHLEIAKSYQKNIFGALQLTPEGKIYVSHSMTKYLGVIHSPNILGLDCKFENNYISLKTGKMGVGIGLPNFISNFFEPKLSGNITYFDINKVKIGEKMILRNVQFDYGLTQIKPIHLTDLNDLAEYMQKYPHTRLKLFGHTDNIGNKPANLVLSQKRVKTVKEYLASKNIAETRISFEGFGSSQPLFTNDTEENRAKNRRVEIELLDK